MHWRLPVSSRPLCCPQIPLASPSTILPSHFSVQPANARTRAVQGSRRYVHLRPGPGPQQRRVHLRRSPEAVHGPNPLRRRPIGGFPRRRGGRLYGKSLDRRLRLLDSGFNRLCPVSFLPGTCDLTPRLHRRVRFRGSRCVERSHQSRTLNRLFSWSSWEWPRLPGLPGVCP